MLMGYDAERQWPAKYLLRDEIVENDVKGLIGFIWTRQIQETETHHFHNLHFINCLQQATDNISNSFTLID